MRDHFVFLAKRNDQQHVTLCMHNIVHLTWEQKTLHINPKDFKHIARFLKNAAASPDSKGGDTVNYFVRGRDGHTQVWLLGMGLYLAPVDLLLLADLAQTAAQRLAELPPDKPFQALNRTVKSKTLYNTLKINQPAYLN
ncbi:MAG TPA: hypothetical protein EYP10_10385 [Armatimonadetes bacterium]|nr:hypothetical protein [Armatimonadota bacterium]